MIFADLKIGVCQIKFYENAYFRKKRFCIPLFCLKFGPRSRKIPFKLKKKQFDMIKKKDEFAEKNRRDTNVTENSFTQAVKKASGEGNEPVERPKSNLVQEETPKIALEARDELIRAKEAKNDTTIETERFRRDER